MYKCRTISCWKMELWLITYHTRWATAVWQTFNNRKSQSGRGAAYEDSVADDILFSKWGRKDEASKCFSNLRVCIIHCDEIYF